MVLLIITFFLTSLVAVLYLINNFLLNHWKRNGIPQAEPKFLFGDLSDSMLYKKSFAENLQDIYEKFKGHRIFGLYVSYRPMLMINDPKIIRAIMIKDSDVFPDRGFHSDDSFDPLSDQLFFQSGLKWKKLRKSLMKGFTASKLKATIPASLKNTQILTNFMTSLIERGEDVFNFRDLIARLNTNLISSIAFGMELDTINQPDHIMRQMGVKIFEPSLIAGLRFFTAIFMPFINRLFKFKMVNNEIEAFFTGIILDTVKYREKNDMSYHRDDLMQKLIQLKNVGFGDSEHFGKISLSEVFAQSFGFYLGGFETTSTTVSYGLYELAKHPEIQKKAQEEVDALFTVSDDVEAIYETISNLKYLKCIMSEILRKYTPLPVLSRMCEKDYRIENSSYIIKKGTPVLIPTFAIHRCENIYENPQNFNPDRFIDNPNGGKDHIVGSYYLPFGEGQRICIGNRLGKLNVMFQLATLLTHFNLELQDPKRHSSELKFNPKQLFLQPIGNIYLKVSLRKK